MECVNDCGNDELAERHTRLGLTTVCSLCVHAGAHRRIHNFTNDLVSRDLIRDPVFATDGHVYDCSSLLK